MEAHVFLADYASATPDGKLTAVGMGWTFTGPGQVSYSVAAVIDVDWTESNQPHKAELAMLDSDGHPFLAPDGQPCRAEMDFEVGRPPGHPAGVGFKVPVAIQNVTMVLPPSTRYEWVLSIDGHADPSWRVAFTTRPASPDIRLVAS